MSGTTASDLNSDDPSMRGERFALVALAFAIVALTAMSLVSFSRTSIVTLADGDPVPIRVVASPGS